MSFGVNNRNFSKPQKTGTPRSRQSDQLQNKDKQNNTQRRHSDGNIPNKPNNVKSRYLNSTSAGNSPREPLKSNSEPKLYSNPQFSTSTNTTAEELKTENQERKAKADEFNKKVLTSNRDKVPITKVKVNPRAEINERLDVLKQSVSDINSKNSDKVQTKNTEPSKKEAVPKKESSLNQVLTKTQQKAQDTANQRIKDHKAKQKQEKENIQPNQAPSSNTSVASDNSSISSTITHHSDKSTPKTTVGSDAAQARVNSEIKKKQNQPAVQKETYNKSQANKQQVARAELASTKQTINTLAGKPVKTSQLSATQNSAIQRLVSNDLVNVKENKDAKTGELKSTTYTIKDPLTFNNKLNNIFDLGSKQNDT
jgi:hypothetical protein